ncbi:recombinase family protein [Microbacterium sp. kSW2-24]|uniref:recombinase family protein n=1 Tax=Microbacterium galbinum TaxID=2851646 RepID=UPI001FFC6C3D|nr:recombinase family protein [Microbacterium galbinum]MCK2024615.1 recombinase family protein [Microbacterium galbinum]
MPNLRPVAESAPRRAVAMIRVSKEREEMHSPEMQRVAIEKYADANNLQIIDWVEGIDESGSDKRSAWWSRLDQSIARMEAREFELILVWRFSRVGRQRLRWAVALDRVDTLGGMIISVLEPVESATASGRFARGMLGEMNAYQAELIGEQWRETHERRRRAGLPHGNHRRFGYELIDGRFEPDPVTGPILAEIYRRALRGDGTGRITRWLNEAGVLTTAGMPWLATNLYAMLDGGFGAGLIVHRPNWKNKRLPKTEWIFHPGAHAAVIEPREWADYWARRVARSEPSRSVEARHLLTGIIYCGDCGARMNYSDRRYVCTFASRSKGTGRRIVTINAEIAERAVEEWVMSLANDTDALLAARAASNTHRVRSVNDADAIARRIARIDERMATLTIRALDETAGIPEAAYRAAVQKLDAERSSLAERQQSFEIANARTEVDVRQVATTLANAWESLETFARRQALMKVTSAVLVRIGKGADRVLVVPKWSARG